MTRMAAMLAAVMGGGGLLAAQAPAPAVIDLGTLGGPFAYATAINNRQQVVGQSIDAAETQFDAFLWEDGVMRGLSTPALRFQLAQDINDRGQVVGWGQGAQGELVSLSWQDGVLTQLPIPAGATYCSPEAINDHSDIVGFCDQRPLPLFTIWRRTGEVVNVGSVPEGASARAVDVTNHGVVLITTEEPGSGQRILLWNDGVVTDVTNPMWNPTALNERNVIAGWGGTYPEFAAVIVDGVLHALPQAPSHRRSGAEGINDRGDVVGFDSQDQALPVVWSDGRRQVLPLPPGSTTGNAVDINERGVAIGNYARMPGETRALLWPKASTRIAPRGSR
jgi:probable HAF family extracellular repeat protein